MNIKRFLHLRGTKYLLHTAIRDLRMPVSTAGIDFYFSGAIFTINYFYQNEAHGEHVYNAREICCAASTNYKYF